MIRISTMIQFVTLKVSNQNYRWILVNVIGQEI